MFVYTYTHTDNHSKMLSFLLNADQEGHLAYFPLGLQAKEVGIRHCGSAYFVLRSCSSSDESVYEFSLRFDAYPQSTLEKGVYSLVSAQRDTCIG